MRSYIWRIAKYVIKNEKMPLVFFAGHLRNGVNKIINNCIPIFFIDENGDYDKVNFFILKSCASYVRQIPKQLLLEMIRPIIKLYA
jgi:hypothetical protein